MDFAFDRFVVVDEVTNPDLRIQRKDSLRPLHSRSANAKAASYLVTTPLTISDKRDRESVEALSSHRTLEWSTNAGLCLLAKTSKVERPFGALLRSHFVQVVHQFVARVIDGNRFRRRRIIFRTHDDQHFVIIVNDLTVGAI